jgi:AAA+ superfamily predicted ATPase
MMGDLPAWAETMREVFRGGTTSQFLLHGNVFDLVPLREGEATRFVPLARFLTDVLFAPFDVVLFYNRGKGIRCAKGEKTFQEFLTGFDRFNQTTYASAPLTMPKDPRRALELLDRFLLYALHRRDATAPAPIRTGIVVEHAEFVAPQGEAIQLASELGESVIRLLDWAADPAILGANIATVLVSESLRDLHRLIVESPFVHKIRVGLPDEAEALDYLRALAAELPAFAGLARLALAVLAKRAVGLSRVNLRNLVTYAVQNGKPIDGEYFARTKREVIEKECFGLLEFIESTTTLDMVSGHDEAKAWLRQDTELLRRGETAALPMGYLLAGRIGTGKTYITTCWAGEIGIPCVVLKNFRDKWQGSTEGNLEKIFNVLHALGQVLVFVDEADQATGRRGGSEGDAGVSGRVYGMLAAEMANTENRGRILWVFATSRPDLLEVDLKRAGRLDVHISLFPPEDAAARNRLFQAMARKVGLRPEDGELPPIPANLEIGGNEMEAILVQARRRHLLREGPDRKPLGEIVAETLRNFRPSAHTRELEYMDLVAVKECTDARFLPERFRKMSLDDVEKRIAVLRPLVERPA